MPRKLVSFDWAIKRILRSKANFSILEGFLSELLFDDIVILEVLESESNQDFKKDKFNRLDIKVKNTNHEIILIEIQYSSELDYLQRILYATSKAITEHLKEGDSYANISKVISINILYFDFGEGDDYIYKGTTNFMGVHNKTSLRLNAKQQQLYKSTKVEKLYPEYYLIKVKNFNDHAKSNLDEWIYFLKNEEIKDSFKARGLKKAKQTLDYLKMSDAERLNYEYHQKELHHRASIYESTFVIGKIEGIQEGIQEEKKNSQLQLEQQKKAHQLELKHKLQQEKQNTQHQLVKTLAGKGFQPENIADVLAIPLERVQKILV